MVHITATTDHMMEIYTFAHSDLIRFAYNVSRIQIKSENSGCCCALLKLRIFADNQKPLYRLGVCYILRPS